MKVKISFLALLLAGCSSTNDPIEKQHIVLDPHAITFAKGVDTMYVSITHNCTCPFQWTTKPDSTISMVASGSGDNPKVPVVLKRSILTQDTTHSMLRIHSTFGDDSVAITEIR